MRGNDAQTQGHGRRGSLFGLLARNYLLFILVLFLIAFGVYLLWNTQADLATTAVGAQYGITDTESFDELTYEEAYQYSQALDAADRDLMKIWLLIIPLYLAATGLFILWMRRSIGKPLGRLNDAVVAQLQDHCDGDSGRDDTEPETVYVGNCGGPQEIRRIGESFDALSMQLEKSEDERRRLDEERQKLIADISHDLKTPITVISGYADALCAGKVPPEEVDRYLRAIQQKSTVLVDLIGEFSEYGKVEHPQFKLHRIKTDFCEFVRSYLVRHYDEIDLNGFSLEVDIPENPQYVLLDEFQFLRVLDNLVSNSLKHNRLGTVLSVDVVPLDESVVLRFADNGARIQGNQAKRIFEPFVTGDAARSNPGSGLGLSISRRIVELHGGTIALSPSPHHGRTNEFVITLPTLR